MNRRTQPETMVALLITTMLCPLVLTPIAIAPQPPLSHTSSVHRSMTSSKTMQVGPSVCNDAIAFTNGTQPTGAQICYYNVTSHVMKYVSSVPGSWASMCPTMYGNVIAFGVVWGLLTWELAYYDIGTGTTTLTGVNVTMNPVLSVYDDIITLASVKGDPGIVYFYNISDGTLKTTGQVGAYPDIYKSIIAFQTSENTTGTDLDGDGDLDDNVIRYYDISAGATTNTGAVGDYPSIDRDVIAFSTSEAQAGQDLNGDGDLDDHVIRYYCIPPPAPPHTQVLVNTRTEGERCSLCDGILAFETNETSVGLDLNGDGDTNDMVVRFYNSITGRTTAVGSALAGCNPSICGTYYGTYILAFETEESWSGDLNGDGNLDDTFIRYARLPMTSDIGGVPMTSDVDGDGYGSILDYTCLGNAYGSKGEARFDSRADLNGDGKIDMIDFTIWSAHYGDEGILGGPNVNNDWRVDMFDAYIIMSAFGSTGQHNWNPRADLKEDGLINILDGIVLGWGFLHRLQCSMMDTG